MRHRCGMIVVATVLLVMVWGGGASALGDVVGRDLSGRVDMDIVPLYEGPRAVPSGQGAPDEDALLDGLLDLLYDLDEPDDGDRAALDTDFFRGLFLTEPDFGILLDGDRDAGLERIFAVVYLYDLWNGRWVFLSRHAGGWRDDRLAFRVEVADGGRYDQGVSGDGRVEVALALGVGLVEDYDDGLGVLLSLGGCRLAGWPSWLLCLLPLAGMAVSGKGF